MSGLLLTDPIRQLHSLIRSENRNYTEFRGIRFYQPTNLLGKNVSAKTVLEHRRETEKETDIYIQYMLPASGAGIVNVCPFSDGCEVSCLAYSGHGSMQKTQLRRLNKTVYFAVSRGAYLRQLFAEIAAISRRHRKNGRPFAVRLNGTSDLSWHRYRVDGLNVFETFPDVQFYDYTKSPYVLRASIGVPNWHLTFSLGASNERTAIAALASRINVAVVYRGKLPDNRLQSVHGAVYDVLDGNVSDLRYNDPVPCIVGLTARGKTADLDDTGFMRIPGQPINPAPASTGTVRQPLTDPDYLKSIYREVSQ